MSKEKQFDEMQVDLMLSIVKSDNGEIKCGDTVQNLIDKGWHKQSEGYWIENRKVCFSPYCSNCGAIGDKAPYCHHCGAKMKGGEDNA